MRPYAGCDSGPQLGEYNAIVSAGGMEMADAMKVVRRRGILMEEAVPAGEGAMAAVLGMEDAKIEEILSGISAPTLPITTARVRLSSLDMRRQWQRLRKS